MKTLTLLITCALGLMAQDAIHIDFTQAITNIDDKPYVQVDTDSKIAIPMTVGDITAVLQIQVIDVIDATTKTILFTNW